MAPQKICKPKHADGRQNQDGSSLPHPKYEPFNGIANQKTFQASDHASEGSSPTSHERTQRCMVHHIKSELETRGALNPRLAPS